MTRTGNVVSLRCGFSDCMAPLLHMAYLRDIDVDGLVSRHLPASSESKQFGSRSRALATLLDFASNLVYQHLSVQARYNNNSSQHGRSIIG